MPGRKTTYLLLTALIITGCCGSEVVTENDKVNRWVHGIMEKEYLWSDFMPEDWEENIYKNPYTFFNTLVYRENNDIFLDDDYSRIVYTGDESNYWRYEEGSEYAAEARAYDFGIGVRYHSVGGCHVTHVVAGSPADRQGIKRGYCFNKANGATIKSYQQLAEMLESNPISIDFCYPEEKTVNLTKYFYTDNPIHFDTIYDLNPKTGYFVYNHFTDGENNGYYNQLREVFARFYEAGVENIIADLRFNGGGELTAARRLASLLAPRADLNKVYLYKERNSSFGQPDAFESETLLPASQMQGYNCDLGSLYFLTNSNTASASELVIHCLRPLYDNAGLRFVHVGEPTEGKNVGGAWHVSSQFEWEFYPITFRVYDINKVSGYETGLIPDIFMREYDREDVRTTDSGEQYIPLGQLGDIAEELMLRRAMDDIYGIGGWLDTPSGHSYAAPVRSSSYGYPVYREHDNVRTTVRYRPLIETRVTSGPVR